VFVAILEDTFTAALAIALSAACKLPTQVDAVKPLPDDHLLEAQRVLADTRRALDAAASLVAGEILFRSRRELGYAGLAQRTGHRTAEKLVQHTTGSTARDAVSLVSVGGLVHDAAAVDSGASVPSKLACPWLVAVGAAVAAGSLAVESAQAIRVGLGQPSEHLTIEELTSLAAILLAEAGCLDADQLRQAARDLRDESDTVGVADRERQIHLARGLRRTKRPDGGTRWILDLDLESGAYLNDLHDKLMSPRRNGPRFVTETDRVWAEAIATDPRSDEQYAHDAITELIRLGVGADSSVANRQSIVGSRKPSVRVLTTARAIEQRDGIGRIEGVATPVSIATVDRHACTDGTISIAFDENGQALNLGREQRLFTTRQRIALAARDGGCRAGDCDKPPSWCEAHHIQHWERDHGRTDIADGILLCRYHHMLIHNNNWEITRDADGYWLIPPPGTPGVQRELMPTLSAALRDLLRERG
jgi:hypothetical protein